MGISKYTASNDIRTLTQVPVNLASVETVKEVPSLWCVSLCSNLQLWASNGIVLPRARILSGGSGYTTECLVDFADGATIVLPGTNVRVDVFYDFYLDALGPVTEPTCEFGAIITRTTSPVWSATYQATRRTIDCAAAYRFVVPRHARAVRSIAENGYFGSDTITPGFLQQIGTAGGGEVVAQRFAFECATHWWPLHPGAYAVDYYYDEAAAGTSIAVGVEFLLGNSSLGVLEGVRSC